MTLELVVTLVLVVTLLVSRGTFVSRDTCWWLSIQFISVAGS